MKAYGGFIPAVLLKTWFKLLSKQIPTTVNKSSLMPQLGERSEFRQATCNSPRVLWLKTRGPQA